MSEIPELAMQKVREVLREITGDRVLIDIYAPALARALMSADRDATEQERAKVPEWLRELLEKYPLGTQMVSPIDDLDGEVVGYYRTREGKFGLALQQNGKRIVHVYQTKWWEQPATIRKGDTHG